MRDASLQPLTGITVAQGADQVEAHHGFESIQSIFVCRFQNRIQAKLVHESIQQINVPEDKRDQLGICQDTSKKLVRSLFTPEEPQQGLCPYASLPQDIFLT